MGNREAHARARDLPRFSPEAERFFDNYRRSGDTHWHELPDGLRVLVWDAMISARCSWDTRVLDACKLHLGFSAEEFVGAKDGADMPEVLLRQPIGSSWTRRSICHGATFDAARHVAALAVLPTLSEATRAALGECP